MPLQHFIALLQRSTSKNCQNDLKLSQFCNFFFSQITQQGTQITVENIYTVGVHIQYLHDSS